MAIPRQPRALDSLGTPRNIGTTSGQLDSQQLKTLKSNVLGNVASLIADNSISRIDDDAGARLSKKSGRAPLSAREARADFEARRKQTENLVKAQTLRRLREEDQQRIREKCERKRQMREQQFENLFERISNMDVLRIEATQMIRQHEMEQERKREALYTDWDTNVSQRVESQLMKYVKHQTLGDGYRDTILPGDDPLKRATHDQKREDDFSIAADLHIKGAEHAAKENMSLKDLVKQREYQEYLVSHRSTSREVLPPQMWEQRQLYASPYGHFMKSCESQTDAGGEFHSLRRMGENVHLPDETDGIPTAGKTKNRLQKNLLGMLEGKVAKEGESALFKASHGASSGAPCQDHHSFEKGSSIVDVEFPVGKKCFPALRNY